MIGVIQTVPTHSVSAKYEKPRRIKNIANPNVLSIMCIYQLKYQLAKILFIKNNKLKKINSLIFQPYIKMSKYFTKFYIKKFPTFRSPPMMLPCLVALG